MSGPQGENYWHFQNIVTLGSLVPGKHDIQIALKETGKSLVLFLVPVGISSAYTYYCFSYSPFVHSMYYKVRDFQEEMYIWHSEHWIRELDLLKQRVIRRARVTAQR